VLRVAFVACVSLVLALSFTVDGGRAAAQAEPPPPGARDDEARGLFEAGKAAYEDGRFEDALAYFERAYALSPRPGLQYNLGLAYDRLRRDAEALQAFETYLSEQPDPAREQEVQNRVRALREHLARRAEVERAQAAVAPAVAPAPPKVVEHAPRRSDRSRKRWIWAAVGAGVAVVSAGIIATWAVSRDDGTPRPKPNTDIIIEALAWH
jgi:tetratricopeptide (TPR) repeat protein